MALTFEQVIAGAPPTGGDSGSEVARKINDNFLKLASVALTSDNTNATKVLLATNTGAKYGLSGVSANVDNLMANLPLLDSFMVFCGNVNANMLDAAFGKNNETIITNLGKQLAMYTWFKGDSKAAYPFTNLVTCNTLDSIFNNPFAFSELLQSATLITLINASPYALMVYNSYTLTETAQLGQAIASFGTSSPTSYTSFSAACSNSTLVNAIFTSANDAKLTTIRTNLSTLDAKLGNYEYTATKILLKLAGQSYTVATTAAEYCASGTLKSNLAAVFAVANARAYLVTNCTHIKTQITTMTSLMTTASLTGTSNTSSTLTFNTGNVLVLRVWNSLANPASIIDNGLVTPAVALASTNLSVEPTTWSYQFATNPFVRPPSVGSSHTVWIKYIACA